LHQFKVPEHDSRRNSNFPQKTSEGIAKLALERGLQFPPHFAQFDLSAAFTLPNYEFICCDWYKLSFNPKTNKLSALFHPLFNQLRRIFLYVSCFPPPIHIPLKECKSPFESITESSIHRLQLHYVAFIINEYGPFLGFLGSHIDQEGTHNIIPITSIKHGFLELDVPRKEWAPLISVNPSKENSVKVSVISLEMIKNMQQRIKS